MVGLRRRLAIIDPFERANDVDSVVRAVVDVAASMEHGAAQQIQRQRRRFHFRDAQRTICRLADQLLRG